MHILWPVVKQGVFSCRFIDFGNRTAHTVHMRKPKPAQEKVVRRNITLHPTVAAHAQSFFLKAGFSGLSEYVQTRLRTDLGLDRGDLLTEGS